MPLSCYTGPAGRRPTLSIVMASYNRQSQLKHCLEKVRANVRTDHELIIVAGGSDGTIDWLSSRDDMVFLPEQARQGATRAYNRGLRAATGQFVLWLNDDSYPLPGAVEAALAMFNRPDLPDLGMVAFYHNEPLVWNQLDTVYHDEEAYSIYHVRGFPYANFGLIPRDLLEQVGFLDERYYFCAWDPDLSLKVQRQAGRQVLGCRQALIRHDQVIDDRKRCDAARVGQDNEQLFVKWRLPPKGLFPDPRPAYRRRWCGLDSGLKSPESTVSVLEESGCDVL